jgi:hypothetical protein
MDSFNIDTSCDDIVGVLLVGLGRIVGVAGLWIELSNYQGGCSPHRGENLSRSSRNTEYHTCKKERWITNIKRPKKTAGNKIARSENNKGLVSLRYSINIQKIRVLLNRPQESHDPFFRFLGRFALEIYLENSNTSTTQRQLTHVMVLTTTT